MRRCFAYHSLISMPCRHYRRSCNAVTLSPEPGAAAGCAPPTARWLSRLPPSVVGHLVASCRLGVRVRSDTGLILYVPLYRIFLVLRRLCRMVSRGAFHFLLGEHLNQTLTVLALSETRRDPLGSVFSHQCTKVSRYTAQLPASRPRHVYFRTRICSLSRMCTQRPVWVRERQANDLGLSHCTYSGVHCTRDCNLHAPQTAMDQATGSHMPPARLAALPVESWPRALISASVRTPSPSASMEAKSKSASVPDPADFRRVLNSLTEMTPSPSVSAAFCRDGSCILLAGWLSHACAVDVAKSEVVCGDNHVCFGSWDFMAHASSLLVGFGTAFGNLYVLGRATSPILISRMQPCPLISSACLATVSRGETRRSRGCPGCGQSIVRP
jgi:hypothetical protein